MKILFLHNWYQSRGGEDECFCEQSKMLELCGHTVRRYHLSNDAIGVDFSSRFRAACSVLWNWSSYWEVCKIIKSFDPDVVHAINIFPLLSPAVFYAAHGRCVPVVHEIANYRNSCSNALFFRQGKVCTECLGSALPWPAILNRCYRDSTIGSATVAAGMVLHRLLGTWERIVDAIVCPSLCVKEKLVEGGIPGAKIVVKNNSVRVPQSAGRCKLGFVVYVGRLTEEKGVPMLIDTWRRNSDLPSLKIIGSGPLAGEVAKFAGEDRRVDYLGQLDLQQVLEVVGRAECLLMTSIWMEPFGRTTIEAFGLGVPVIGSDIGGTREIITDGYNGFTFAPGSCVQLAEKIKIFMTMPAERRFEMQAAALRTYSDRYTPERNCRSLVGLYENLIKCKYGTMV